MELDICDFLSGVLLPSAAKLGNRDIDLKV